MAESQVPYAQMVKYLLGLHLYFRGGRSKNPQSTKSLKQCKSGPSNNMQVNWSNYLLYHFSITISFTSLVFTRKNAFKKITRENAHWTNNGVWMEGAWAPWPYMHSYNCLFSWKNENLIGKSSNELLYTAKILQEAVHLTSPYLGQIT